MMKKSTPEKNPRNTIKKAGGRPTKMTPEKIKLLNNLCRMKPTIKDCEEILEVDSTTIEKWIARNYKQSFSEFRNQRMAHTRFMIIRNIIRQCEQGNTTMLIYASKNLCGWSDKVETELNSKIEIKIDNEDQLL